MLAQKIIFSYSSKIGIQIVQIIASIIVARFAGASVLGTVAFGLAYVSIFLPIADLGSGTAHIKKISEGENIPDCIATFSLIKVILTIIYIMSVTSFFFFQKYVLNVQFESKEHIYVIFVLLFTVSINEIYKIIKLTFSGLIQTAKVNIPELISALIYQLLRILLVILGYKAISLAFGKLVSIIVIMPFYLFYFNKMKVGKFNISIAKEYFRISIPVFFIMISTSLLATIDKVLLQFYTSSATVGIYSAGYRFASFVLVLGVSMGQIFFPKFSKAFKEEKHEIIINNIRKYERFIFIYLMPIVILFSFNSDFIVRFFLGVEFIESIKIMKIINISLLLYTLHIPYGNVVTGAGDFKTASKLLFVMVVLYLIVLYLFINPKIINLEGLGAAFSLLFYYVMYSIVFRINSKKYINKISNRLGVKFIGFGIINYIVFNFILTYVEYFSTITGRIFFSLLYIIVTYFTMYIFRLVIFDDLQYIKEIINIKKMKKYLRNEIKGR